MNNKVTIAAIALMIAMQGAKPSHATETENQNLQILPAPGPVTIDGKINDWDLSGGIFACGDVENQRDQYATWFYAMYDKDNLYLLSRWIDRTPLNNPGSTLGDFGWSGDCLQVRVITRPDTPQATSSNLTCWKGVDGRDVVDIASPFFVNGPQGVDVKPKGAQQAFTINPDNSGYTQEIAIPWKLLSGDGYAPVPGDHISLTIEPNFTIGAGGRLSTKDIFKPGVQIDRVFTFQNRPIWGVGTLAQQGHVPVRPVRLSDARQFPVSLHGTDEIVNWDGLIKSPELPGFVTIKFDMPGDGYISLNIRDANGTPVCNLLNQAFYSKGPHQVKWDGLTTMRFHQPGTPVPAGHYTWNAIYNPGIDLKLRGWASGAGSAPWDGGPGTGWGGEGPPVAVATDGASMYLGWSGSEAGKAVVATDLDGNVHWRQKRGGFGGAEFLAADNGVVYVLDGDSSLYLLNAKDGTYHAWAGTPDSDIPIANLWGAEPAMPAEINGMDVRDNTLFVSSSRPAVAREDVSDWLKILAQLRDGAAAGNAFDTAVWDKVDAGTQGRIEAALKVDKLALLNGQPYQYDDARDVVRGILGSESRPLVEAAFPGLIKHIRTNFIASIDCTNGRVIKIIDADRPGKLKVAADGNVYFVSGDASVCSLNPRTGAIKTVVAGLVAATDIATGPDGSLYVGLSNPANQVRVYDAAGHPRSTIGRAGGRQLLGPWQEDGMRFVAGLCLDARGRLWVAEEDLNPKRISVWDAASGKLVNEFYGATHYGASGGAIDPRDPNIMVGEGCEWALDPVTGHARCTGVFDRENLAFLGGESFARFAQGYNGRQYLLALCSAQYLKIFERLGEGNYILRASIKADRATGTTIWADRNGDGQVQPDETQVVPGLMALGGYYGWSLYANTDLTLYPELGKDSSGQLKVAGFTACGAPLYDPAAMVKLPFGGGVPSLDNRSVLTENWNTSNFEAYDVASGKMMWSYPSQFIGVHGSHNAPPPETGMIRGAFGVVGSATVPGAAGTIWAINTNVGEWHILNSDGFYLTRLFQGDLFKIRFPDPATPGADMDNVPPGLGGEDFGGSLVQARDGKLYVQAGKTADWNIALTGVDDLRAMPGGPITIADSDLAKATAFRETYIQTYVGQRKYTVKMLSPQFTGNLDLDFKGADTLTYRKSDESLTHSAAAWDANNLYLAWNVSDNTPWTNGATDPAQMYISGDTVDFQLANDPKADSKRTAAVAGDLRLSIGNFQGKPTAMLYRKVSTIKQPMVFSSGVVHAYPMDYVATLPDANIKVSVLPGHGYTVEAAIPLRDLDLTPADGLTLHGDFGVTFGDPNGQRTRLRSYWANQHTGIVDDAVYELMMEPQYWGEFDFGK